MIARLVAHVRSLWTQPEVAGRRGWAGWAVLLPLPFVAWPLVCLARGERRLDLALFLLVPALAWGNRATKKLFLGVFPLGFVPLLYDGMRFFRNTNPARVHDCDLRALELSVFGITVGGVRETVHDWLQQHTALALDVVCAIPYGTFIYVSVVFAIFLYRKNYPAVRRYAWTFFILNAVAFATYNLYPAAPPWYFHAHGCVVDMATRGNEGPNLARVDAAMGLMYFKSFYGRSNNVFGAMPSMHVAYPLLIVLEGWSNFRAPMRVASVIFSALMVFAAAYLDHHWILDVLAGLSYCVIVHLALRFVFARLAIGTEPGSPSRGAGHPQPPRAARGLAVP